MAFCRRYQLSGVWHRLPGSYFVMYRILPVSALGLSVVVGDVLLVVGVSCCACQVLSGWIRFSRRRDLVGVFLVPPPMLLVPFPILRVSLPILVLSDSSVSCCAVILLVAIGLVWFGFRPILDWRPLFFPVRLS